jgi:hypothetical protein
MFERLREFLNSPRNAYRRCLAVAPVALGGDSPTAQQAASQINVAIKDLNQHVYQQKVPIVQVFIAQAAIKSIVLEL